MSEINAFDRIIGYEDIKAELEELGDVLQNTNKYRQCGVRTPRGLLDDMDKFANDDEWHINSEEFVTIQACMDEISEEVFVIATVNDLRQIPESLLRKGRFDRKIEVPGPDHASAVKIVRHYLSEKKSVGNVDAGLIASILNGESCAALETIINEAGIQAVRQNRQRIVIGDELRKMKLSAA